MTARTRRLSPAVLRSSVPWTTWTCIPRHARCLRKFFGQAGPGTLWPPAWLAALQTTSSCVLVLVASTAGRVSCGVQTRAGRARHAPIPAKVFHHWPCSSQAARVEQLRTMVFRGPSISTISYCSGLAPDYAGAPVRPRAFLLRSSFSDARREVTSLASAVRRALP